MTISSRTEISEKTLIPIGFLFVIIGLVFWVGVAWSKVQELEAKQEAYTTIVRNIDNRLANIEGFLRKKDEP